MKRDHLLFALFGVLLGFVAGYLLHEVMAVRQAPLMPFGAGVAGDGPGGPTAPGQLPAAGVDPMQEILQLREYVEANPEDARAVRTLADLNFQIHRWERAADLYARYLELEPGDPDVMTDLGVCHREMGRYELALAAFQRAREQTPEHWQSRYNEVVVLAFDLDRPSDAAPVLTELQALQPDNPQVAELAERLDRLTGAEAAS